MTTVTDMTLSLDSRFTDATKHTTPAPLSSFGARTRALVHHTVHDAAATIRQRKERNRTAIRLLNAWLHGDAEVESDTRDLLKSELDCGRLSGRRLWG